jgi:AcrR family transcriptional regulator
MARPRRRTQPADSRRRILAAAALEFSARGFAGAGIDRIARRARLNKAMIYYHFASKQALYRAILRELYAALQARLDAIRAGSGPPDDKLKACLAALLEEAGKRPHFAPIILREVAEGAPRFDSEILRLIAGLYESIREIVADGQRAGLFTDVHPVVAYMGLMAPVLFFLATAPARTQMRRVRPTELSDLELGAFVARHQEFALRGLRQG